MAQDRSKLSVQPAAEPAPTIRGAFLWVLKSLALLRESWVGMAGVALVAFWVLAALFAPLAAPFDPLEIMQPFAKPGTEWKEGGTFWLGTDHIGRDILSRILWGSRTVLIYAPLATVCAYTVGIAMGLLAGYRRGWWDTVLSRIGDIILSFPVLVLYIIVIATVGASGLNIVVAITFASAPGIMRIVRGLVLDLRNRDYVSAAQTRGEGDWFVMLVEILPNARGPLIVDACLRLGYVVITIAVLGFLGLGLPPPTPDWGTMVSEARPLALAFPYMVVFPCIAISSLILGFNLMADGLREISLRD
ncbi:MAG: ABC transporter permease [Rhodospirillaceae bacterium]|jgi:ABC-type dipeptide/oligopeptide/nickel transport system permease subunit|nr:ABC transporter permease [Rhodospirillaceae bacterium]MBT6117137.1 ABC transporter permease [Rhodospirillaceae bacterium]